MLLKGVEEYFVFHNLVWPNKIIKHKTPDTHQAMVWEHICPSMWQGKISPAMCLDTD